MSENRKPAELIAVPHEEFGLLPFKRVHTFEDGRCVYLTETAFTERAMSERAAGHPCGVDDYALTDVHQWLNSDKKNWWTRKIEGAGVPAGISKPGFMAGLAKEFLDTVQPFGVMYAGRDRKLHEVSAKFFLPSWTELTGETNLGVFEGAWWDAFRQAAEEGGVSGLLKALQKTDPAGLPEWWWQRSCDPGNPDRFRLVYQGGFPGSNGDACYPFYGLAVACVIRSI